MATAEFSKFAGILSAALSQHHLIMPLSGFGFRVMMISWNELGNVFSGCIFWKRLYKVGILSSLNV